MATRRNKAPPVDLRAAAKLSSRVLARAMGELEHFVLEDGARVNPNRWKALAARSDAFQLFRERDTHAGVAARDARALPSLLVSGKVRGRVESALYAAASDSQEQLALLNTFLFGEEVVEGDVVAAVKQPSSSSFKYTLPSVALPAAQPSFCGGKALVKHVKTPRDPVVAKLEYLEHRGYTQSPVGGELVAFFILVPISERVKSGQTSSKSTRLQVDAVEELAHIESLCCLFRQVNDEIVDVFLFASADLSRGLSSTSGGKFPSSGAPLISIDSLLNVANLLECAETKMLTVMLREAQQSVATHSHDKSKPNECSMCRQKKRLFFGGASTFTACEVCGNYVCGRCRIDKRVFVPRLSRGGCGGGVLEKVSACKPCSMAASNGPAATNPSEAPAIVLSERVRSNRAGSRNRGASSSSSFGSRTRSRAGSGCSSSSGSTTSSVGTRLVYYEGDFSSRGRTNSSASSVGLRKMSSASCATPRSAAGSVPATSVHHKYVDHAPQLSGRQRRHESFDGMMPARAPIPSAQARFPPAGGRHRPTKERARSEDWVATGSGHHAYADTPANLMHKESRDPQQHERFPRFTPAMQMPSSRSRPETAGALVPVRSTSRLDCAPSPPIIPTYAMTDSRKRATTSAAAPVHVHPATRGAAPPDFMKRMMELHKLAELSYDTTQRNGAMMAHHLRHK